MATTAVTKRVDKLPRAERIAQLNDQLRIKGTGGQIMITRGVHALTGADVSGLLKVLAEFDEFDADGDPHGERDFGVFDFGGAELMWKIDYYSDADLRFGSNDADGKPLGVVEAKRSRKDPREGKIQAKLYADCLEMMCGQRPIIFYTNGYDHWIWDDTRYPPRPIQGFLTRDEVALTVQRRTSRQPLNSVSTNREIAGGGGRTYQEKAIRAVCHRFEDHDRGGEHQRKALLVMATGRR